MQTRIKVTYADTRCNSKRYTPQVRGFLGQWRDLSPHPYLRRVLAECVIDTYLEEGTKEVYYIKYPEQPSPGD